MAVELVDRLAILMGDRRRFIGMGAADSRSLRCDSYVRMYHIVRRSTCVPYIDGLGGICGDNSCTVFLLLFMLLWLPISVMLCKRALPMLWHVFLFLGLRHVGFFLLIFSFLIGYFHCFFL
jgi:hypothetical protein